MRNTLYARGFLALGLLLAAGCATGKRTVVPPAAQARPALDATRAELLERYNAQARRVRSISAAVEFQPVAGSTFSGVIVEYRDVRGFILAQRPAMIRVLGQAPVIAKNIFDMVSDGREFHIFLPTKGKFIVGPADYEKASARPIENLRPQHLTDAIFWSEVPSGSTVLTEEADAAPRRYYVLTVLRNPQAPEIAKKIWFDRADLSVARIQRYAAAGRIMADVAYSAWADTPSADGNMPFPREIRLARPREDYQLGIAIRKVTLNEEIAAEKFQLAQPSGTELVTLGAAGTRP